MTQAGKHNRAALASSPYFQQRPDGSFEYTGATGNHAARGEFVTFGKQGDISISRDLCAKWPDGHPYVRFRVRPDARLLLLDPSTENKAGAIRWRQPGGGRARLSCVGVLKALGLMPAGSQRYSARWDSNGLGPAIAIDLGSARATSGTPVRPIEPAAIKVSAGGAPPDQPTQTCPECTQNVPVIIRGRIAYFEEHVDPDGIPCDRKTVSLGGRPKSSDKRFGKRPRVRCAVCGAEKAGVLRSGVLMPFIHAGPEGQERCPGCTRAAKPIVDADEEEQ